MITALASTEQETLMKRYLVIAVFAAAAATSIAFVTRSQAAVSEPSADPQIAALTRQTKALQVQVKTLQGQMRTLQRRVIEDEGQVDRQLRRRHLPRCSARGRDPGDMGHD